MKYRVTWEIDVEEDTPLLAALAAETAQYWQHKTTGGVFDVVDESGNKTTIDLEKIRWDLGDDNE